MVIRNTFVSNSAPNLWNERGFFWVGNERIVWYERPSSHTDIFSSFEPPVLFIFMGVLLFLSDLN